MTSEEFVQGSSCNSSLDLATYTTSPGQTKQDQVLELSDGQDRVVYLSRYIPWSFSVIWYSISPTAWLKQVNKLMEMKHDAKVAAITNSIIRPLNDLLVVRNRKMMDHQFLPGQGLNRSFKLDPKLLPVISIPNHLNELSNSPNDRIFTFVCTTHLYAMLADRLMYTIGCKISNTFPQLITIDREDPAGVLSVRNLYPPNTSDEDKKKMDSLMEWYETVHLNWRDVVEGFIEDWDNREETISDVGVSKGKRAQRSTNDSSIDTLRENFYATEHQEQSTRNSRSLERIYQASLALSSLQLFGVKETSIDFRFHEALLRKLSDQEEEGTSQNSLKRKQTGALDNSKFLRPLFACAVVGPIALLHASKLSSKDSGGLTLTQLLQFNMYGIEDTSIERVTIETGLWDLLVDAAVLGQSMIKERLRVLVKEWKIVLGLNTGNTTGVPPLVASDQKLVTSPDIVLQLSRQRETKARARDAVTRYLKEGVKADSVFSAASAIEAEMRRGLKEDEEPEFTVSRTVTKTETFTVKRIRAGVEKGVASKIDTPTRVEAISQRRIGKDKQVELVNHAIQPQTTSASCPPFIGELDISPDNGEMPVDTTCDVEQLPIDSESVMTSTVPALESASPVDEGGLTVDCVLHLDSPLSSIGEESSGEASSGEASSGEASSGEASSGEASSGEDEVEVGIDGNVNEVVTEGPRRSPRERKAPKAADADVECETKASSNKRNPRAKQTSKKKKNDTSQDSTSKDTRESFHEELEMFGLYNGPKGPLRVVEEFPADPDSVFLKPTWHPEDSDTVVYEEKINLPYFGPQVQPNGKVEWVKQPPIEIDIPTTKQEEIMELLAMYDTIQERHKAESFSLKESEPVRVFSQEEWYGMDMEERQSIVSKYNVLLKHDPKAKYHPRPIMSEIKGWNEKEMSLYFDLFTFRQMHDQSWYPFEKEGDSVKSSPISSRGTEKAGPNHTPSVAKKPTDDGRREAAKRVLGWDLSEKPTQCSELKDTLEQEPKEKHGWARVTLPCDAAPDKNATLPLDTAPGKNNTSASSLKREPNARLRKARMEQVLLNAKREVRKFNKKIMPSIINFLDIPLSNSKVIALPIDGFECFPDLQSHSHYLYRFATKIPHIDFIWGLFATQGAISQTHVDAGGCCTHVRIIKGVKIWFILYPDSDKPEHACTDASLERGEDGAQKPIHTRTGGKDGLRAYLSTSEGYQDRALNAFMLVLNEGDDLFMHPDTPHWVISVSPQCLAVGGHYYSAPLLNKTMYAMVKEHILGHLTTNTIHSSAGILFIRMLSYTLYLKSRNKAMTVAGIAPTATYGNSRIPSEEEVAYLIVIVSYLNQLDPSEIVDLDEEMVDLDEELADADKEMADLDEEKKHKKLDDRRKRVLDEKSKSKLKRAPLISRVYHPDGEMVYYDEAQGNIVIDHEKKSSVWQLTAEFRKDFEFATTHLIPEYLSEFSSGTLIQSILIAEQELLHWSDAICSQLDEDDLGRAIRASRPLYTSLEPYCKTYGLTRPSLVFEKIPVTKKYPEAPQGQTKDKKVSDEGIDVQMAAGVTTGEEEKTQGKSRGAKRRRQNAKEKLMRVAKKPKSNV